MRGLAAELAARAALRPGEAAASAICAPKMAVAGDAFAHVLYDDGELFEVSTETERTLVGAGVSTCAPVTIN
jgi:hypothetical protein